MKITKAGIRIFEDGDPAPPAYDAFGQLYYMIDELRKELNKAAEAIDKLQDQIDGR